MEIKSRIKSNWLTNKPQNKGLVPTIFLMSLLLFSSFIYLNNFFQAHEWMSATQNQVFLKKEWWRAWSTLFAHGDVSHIIGNLFLFFPFSYYLIGYYGSVFFPLFGFFSVGLVNLFVLSTMPLNISLVGVSGVLYWMGGSWLALYWLIDKRESKGRRVLKVIAVTIVLFVPDSYLPNISYISHFLGYFAGVFSGILYYLIFRNKILSAEVIEQISDEELDEEYYNEDEPNDPKDPLPSSSHSSQKE